MWRVFSDNRYHFWLTAGTIRQEFCSSGKQCQPRTGNIIQGLQTYDLTSVHPENGVGQWNLASEK